MIRAENDEIFQTYKIQDANKERIAINQKFNAEIGIIETENLEKHKTLSKYEKEYKEVTDKSASDAAIWNSKAQELEGKMKSSELAISQAEASGNKASSELLMKDKLST